MARALYLSYGLTMSERFGGWELDALVASGGVGEVWRARDAQGVQGVQGVQGGVVAVKRLHAQYARSDEARAQFALECRAAIEVPPHPSLVRGLAAGEVDGRPYLVMALVPGSPLRAAAPQILASVSDAAAHLHAHGWIHGDINPSNIIVDAGAGAVTLVDLGVVRRAGDGGPVRGTHAYMAPEQVRGEPWTPATDVFALGVVLWELAAGARLFYRSAPWLSLAAVVEAPAPPLADPALDALAQAALAKDPRARLQSAAELAARLRALSDPAATTGA